MLRRQLPRACGKKGGLGLSGCSAADDQGGEKRRKKRKGEEPATPFVRLSSAFLIRGGERGVKSSMSVNTPA